MATLSRPARIVEWLNAGATPDQRALIRKFDTLRGGECEGVRLMLGYASGGANIALKALGAYWLADIILSAQMYYRATPNQSWIIRRVDGHPSAYEVIGMPADTLRILRTAELGTEELDEAIADVLLMRRCKVDPDGWDDEAVDDDLYSGFASRAYIGNQIVALYYQRVSTTFPLDRLMLAVAAGGPDDRLAERVVCLPWED